MTIKLTHFAAVLDPMIVAFGCSEPDCWAAAEVELESSGVDYAGLRVLLCSSALAAEGSGAPSDWVYRMIDGEPCAVTPHEAAALDGGESAW